MTMIFLHTENRACLSLVLVSGHTIMSFSAGIFHFFVWSALAEKGDSVNENPLV